MVCAVLKNRSKKKNTQLSVIWAVFRVILCQRTKNRTFLRKPTQFNVAVDLRATMAKSSVALSEYPQQPQQVQCHRNDNYDYDGESDRQQQSGEE
jgi:hypothetical protein